MLQLRISRFPFKFQLVILSMRLPKIRLGSVWVTRRTPMHTWAAERSAFFPKFYGAVSTATPLDEDAGT
jgi:hypothetical protein